MRRLGKSIPGRQNSQGGGFGWGQPQGRGEAEGGEGVVRSVCPPGQPLQPGFVLSSLLLLLPHCPFPPTPHPPYTSSLSPPPSPPLPAPSPPLGQVLELLKVAWKRRLIFTVGTSSTTGETDTVVWNEIHHKTEMDRNVTGHGYPDPNYLQNVLAELAAQGVTEDCLEQQ